MNNLFRGIIAGIGAKKLGGGCFSTIIIFIVIYYALGQCSSTFPDKKKTKAPVKVSVVSIQEPAHLKKAVLAFERNK
jgi:hypothetical protein